MVKASLSLSTAEISSNTARAAAEIHALINSRPESPRIDEIESIIAKAVRPVSNPDQARLQAEWDAVLAASRTANEDNRISDEELLAVSATVDDCADLILAHPVRDLADIRLLAEVCYWIHWTDPAGLSGPNADVQLADGPANEGSECDEALAALLRAIRDLPLGQTAMAFASSTAPPDAGTPKLRADYLASDWHRIHSDFQCLKVFGALPAEQVEALIFVASPDLVTHSSTTPASLECSCDETACRAR
jgi:hypothetical protein